MMMMMMMMLMVVVVVVVVVAHDDYHDPDAWKYPSGTNGYAVGTPNLTLIVVLTIAIARGKGHGYSRAPRLSCWIPQDSSYDFHARIQDRSRTSKMTEHDETL